MPRHEETTLQADRRSSVNVDITYAGMPRVTGEAAISASVSMLSKLNYPLWAMRMEVILEAYGLLGAIEDKSVEKVRSPSNGSDLKCFGGGCAGKT